ncbi:MAG: hypothetical protein V1859_10405 [archaeon]
MNKQIIYGIGALFLISLLSLGVMAYQGNQNTVRPNYNADVHEQLEAAIEAGDYDAWIQIRQNNNLPTKGRIFQVVNADNFDLYMQLHNAVEAGDTETANEIRAELGLGQCMMNKGSNNGKGMQGKGSNSQRIQQFTDANNDRVCDNYALHHTN